MGASGARLGFGDVKVLEKVTGYKKIKYFTHDNAGYGDVHLPEMQMHTTACWLTLSETLVERAAGALVAVEGGSSGGDRDRVVEAIRGLGAALETVSTLALMCEPSDINRTLGDGASTSGEDREGPGAPGRDPHAGRTGGLDPTLFLFDALPGGVGLAERIYERAEELLARAQELTASCGCHAGCPACVGPGSGPTHKRLVLRLFALLGFGNTGAEPDSRPPTPGRRPHLELVSGP